VAVRSIDQITKELGNVYNPQIQSINQQKALVPQGVEADINQAKAEQGQAYEDILGGARRRGLGFSGIPLGEQAKYASTVFAPEVLRARQRGRQQELSLQDALLGIYEKRRQYADQLRQGDIAQDQWNQTFGFEKQKWADQLRQQAADRAEAARARAASYGGGYVGGGGLTGGQPQQAPQQSGSAPASKYSDLEKQAYQQLQVMRSNDPASQARELRAIQKSASYGNQLDKIKLIMLQQMTGGYRVPAAALANGGQLRF
jgi:hypothetical protein